MACDHASTLTGRHADILVLLSQHPEGLSADHLAMLLDENDLDVVTIRAEMSRLRRVIGAKYIASRPYRLLAPIDSDLGDVFDALETGDVETALSHYAGPLLPQSVSPAIARLRTELSAGLRGAVLASGRPCAAAALARTARGPRRPGRLAGAAGQRRTPFAHARNGRRASGRPGLRTRLISRFTFRATVMQPRASYLQ